jgi:hypothetical protein
MPPALMLFIETVPPTPVKTAVSVKPLPQFTLVSPPSVVHLKLFPVPHVPGPPVIMPSPGTVSQVNAAAPAGLAKPATPTATKAKTTKTPRNRLLVELAELVERLIAISFFACPELTTLVE